MTIITSGLRGALVVLALIGWAWCASAQAQDFSDVDGDGVTDDIDNCPLVPNFDQADSDDNGVGDACEPDNSVDTDGDTIPDVVDEDDDNDGVLDVDDVCPRARDCDGDGVLDGDDLCPLEPGDGNPEGCPGEDADHDGILDSFDNCPAVANPDQLNTDGDAEGDACDADDDNDGFPDEVDPCPLDSSCGPGTGADADGDGVEDDADRCVPTAAGEVVDRRGCSIADLCPCDNAWRSHDAYVSCTSKAASAFRRAGLIGKGEYRSVTTAASKAQCGYKPRPKPKYQKSKHKRSKYDKPKSKKYGRR
jgi:Thrombospondin type 3 repeat